MTHSKPRLMSVGWSTTNSPGWTLTTTACAVARSPRPGAVNTVSAASKVTCFKWTISMHRLAVRGNLIIWLRLTVPRNLAIRDARASARQREQRQGVSRVDLRAHVVSNLQPIDDVDRLADVYTRLGFERRVRRKEHVIRFEEA